jgi:alpha-N-arabinofuranosidase
VVTESGTSLPGSRPPARGGRRAVRVVACVGVAVLMAAAPLAAAPLASASAVTRSEHPAAGLSPIALGLNTAPWDYVYAANVSAGGGLDTIQPLLKTADIGLLRYGGGSYADYYGWQTNSNIQNCLPDDATASFEVTSTSCATSDSLGFDQFSAQARAIDARSLVTVNYGSGTPAEAAAWVTHARTTAGDGVALWEVGNENYGCWEVNNWLAQPPEDYQGYTPNTYSTVNGVFENPTCPQVTQGDAMGTQTLATSYAANALRFLRAMKRAEPSAQVGVPWAFGSEVTGASVPDNSEWNNTVLSRDGKYAGFVDAHYYPFFFGGSTGGSNPTDQQVLQSLTSVPALYRQIRGKLDTYDPKAKVVVGETGVSNNETTTVCSPTGAIFAAGDVLSWLAAGAESVDWWDMNNYGNTGATCTNPDYGMFTSGSPPTPETPYYGYLLASVLARPHARLRPLTTSDPADVLAYQSLLPGGKKAVAFINTNTAAATTVTFRFGVRPSDVLRTWTYSAGNQNATDSNIVQGTTTASSLGHSINLPPQSMVILRVAVAESQPLGGLG